MIGKFPQSAQERNMNTVQVDVRLENQTAPKKEYEKPSVTTFGSVAKLTMTKGSQGGDGSSTKGAHL